MSRSLRAQLLAGLLGLTQLTGCGSFICPGGAVDSVYDGSWVGDNFTLTIGAQTITTPPCEDRTLVDGIGFRAQPGLPWDRMAFTGKVTTVQPPATLVYGDLWSTAGGTAPRPVAAFKTTIRHDTDILQFRITYTPADSVPRMEDYTLRRWGT